MQCIFHEEGNGKSGCALEPLVWLKDAELESSGYLLSWECLVPNILLVGAIVLPSGPSSMHGSHLHLLLMKSAT